MITSINSYWTTEHWRKLSAIASLSSGCRRFGHCNASYKGTSKCISARIQTDIITVERLLSNALWWRCEQLVFYKRHYFTCDILNLDLQIISVRTIRLSGINPLSLPTPILPNYPTTPQPHPIPQTCRYVRMFLSYFISHKEIAAAPLPSPPGCIRSNSSSSGSGSTSSISSSRSPRRRPRYMTFN